MSRRRSPFLYTRFVVYLYNKLGGGGRVYEYTLASQRRRDEGGSGDERRVARGMAFCVLIGSC